MRGETMRILILTMVLVALMSSTAGCASKRAPVSPVPEDGATWVNVNNYIVPSGTGPFPPKCPSHTMGAMPTAFGNPDGELKEITPASFLPDSGAPHCVGDQCGVPLSVATSGVDGGGAPIVVGILMLLCIGGAAVARHRAGYVLAAILPLVLLVGCTAMHDLGDLTADAFGVATDGDLVGIPGPDGVGIGLEALLASLGGGGVALYYVINFLRNRARRKRGEPVTEVEAVKAKSG